MTPAKVRHLAILRLQERLLRNSYVDPDGCWIWTGAKSKTSGYGLINVRIKFNKYTRATHKRLSVHRVSYEIFYGPIPPGYTIDHDCEKKLCIHPNCLKAMTSAENNAKWKARRIMDASKGFPYTWRKIEDKPKDFSVLPPIPES